MSEEGEHVIDADANGGDKPDDEISPPTQAVTYRPFDMADKETPGLNVFEKGDGDTPKDPPTPVDANVIASITEDTKTNYLVENVPDKPIDTAAVPDSDSDQVQKGIALANEIRKGMDTEGGRRRSRRRHPKKGSRKSKKVGARKSKKSGRSRKNGSKRRAHRKH